VSDSLPATLSAGRLKQFGSRRTAYPTDMTLDDIIRLHLEISPRITAVSKRDGTARYFSPKRLVQETLRHGTAVLLGPPGSGKAMASYRIARQCQDEGCLPILARAEEVDTIADDLTAITRDWPEVQPILLLDGLDEALAKWRKGAGIPRALGRIMPLIPTIATSRTADFKESAELDAAGITFHTIVHLGEWDLDRDFTRYVRRLVALGRLHDESLVVIARKSPNIRRLTARPLHARMLTFVHETDPNEDPPSSEHELYARYVSTMSRVAAAGLSRRGCRLDRRPLELWKDVCWATYRSNAQHADVTTLLDGLGLPTEDRDCATASLDYISDRIDRNGKSEVEFLHYTFYEWLVASHVADGLASPVLTVDQHLELLNADLPREVRHFLREQLAPMSVGLTEQMRQAYEALTLKPDHDRASLMAGNLLVYLIARTSPTAPTVLRALAEREREKFLLNSLLWALCHLGDSDAASKFARLYTHDEEWRAMSRGYVLYYYGDMTVDQGPPYLDREPYVDHEKSSHNRFEMMYDPSYAATVPVQRQLVDALTVLDILRVRHKSLPSEALKLFMRLLDAVRRSDIDGIAADWMEESIGELILEGG
jgi:hypothetical protein